jgi:oligopeptide transport system ATP-binding protein
MSAAKNEKPSSKSFQKAFDYQNADILLQVKHLKQYFSFKGAEEKYLKAVHDISFDVYRGEVFGLVGESGCGKTTTGRDIMKLYQITSGDIWLDGIRIAAGTRWNEKEIKFTNLRAKKAAADLKKQKKALWSRFAEEYQKQFHSKVHEYPYLWLYEKGKKDALKGHELFEPIYAEMKALDHASEDVWSKAKSVEQIQRDKIALAKKDDKNCNKAIAEQEMGKVKERHKALLDKLLDHNPDQLSEAEIAEYHAYKEELRKAKHANIANKVQMIFQDPIASLNPRMTVRNIIAEGLLIQGCHDKAYINSEVARVLKLVGLVPEHANRYPHEFSGGQRQRIGIARAIIMKPELIVADEPVSALDVSVQAQVINLLNDLRNNLGLTLIFIAHNLSVVKYFCDRIAVMYYGHLVELATSDELFAHPLHPYTKSLLSAVPYPDPVIEASRKRIVYNPAKEHDYSVDKPTYRELVPGHFVYCNDAEAKRYLKELGQK